MPAPTPVLPAPARGPVVALTFDACPHPGPEGYDRRLVRILTDSAVAATFFLSGEWVEEHPEETRRLAANPLFEIGNHSYTHPHMPDEHTQIIIRELLRTENLFDSLGIRHAPVFRPPFVETNMRLAGIAASVGLRTFTCDVISGDPDPAFDSARIVRTVLRSVHDGDVVIMHVNGRGWHAAEALPAIIRELRRRGFSFVPASRLPDRSSGGASLLP